MKRLAVVVAAALAGLGAGAGGMLALGDGRVAVGPPGGPAAPAEPARARVPEPAPDPGPPAPADDRTLLVWTPGGLPPGFAAAVASLPGVARVTAVRGDTARLVASYAPGGAEVERTAEGFAYPVDALAIDPAGYASFLPPAEAAVVRALRPGDALLGETAAAVRGVGVHASLEFEDGTRLRVAAVLDDRLVGGAEVVAGQASALAGTVRTPRFLLVAYRGSRAGAESAIRAASGGGAPIRFRAPGETPYLRHGDAVLPQVFLKARFGEFAYRDAAGRDIVLDETWLGDHIVERDVPLLGRVRCHRAIVDDLHAALEELAQRNLGFLVDPAGYAGCFVPRRIEEGAAVSRHSWGTALDVNWPKNPQGSRGAQDPRVVDVFARHGFTWGGPWLVPDPAHFEWVGVAGARI